MKIYVTKDGDTLRKIAQLYRADIEELHSYNRQITGQEMRIPENHIIHIPSPQMQVEEQLDVNPCPPDVPPEYLDYWVPLTSLEQMAQTEYDVVIVGTGAGGGAVLWRLCQEWGANGKRIGVVEAGDLFLPTHALNLPTLNVDRYRRLWTNPKFWKNIGSTAEFAFRQLLAFGGRTIFWNAVTPRMHAADIAAWPVSIEEMSNYYNIAEEIMNVTHSYTEGSSITQILLDRLRKNGFPDADTQPLAVDLQPTHLGEIHSNVWFSSIIFIARALNLRPFDLAVNARAVQVFIENGRAAGVKVMDLNKNSYFLRAKTIVLSTSTFESPRILLNSGIPGVAIGHYLAHHLRMNATGIVNRDEFPENLGTLGLLIPRTEDRPYQIQMQGPGRGREYFTYHYEEKPLRRQWAVDLEASGPVEARFDNKVSLDPYKRDAYGVPEIQVQISYSETDKAIIRLMDIGLKQAAAAMQAPLASIDSFETCLAIRGKDTHETGTCRMGNDPATSATNRFGQIHGVPGLFVADNSVIPTSGAANPTLTNVALAIRTADHIIRQLG